MNIGRVFKIAFVAMWRNGWLTITAISVIFSVFLSLDVFLLFGDSFNKAIRSIEEKVDFTVFFNANAEEDEIFALRDELLRNASVKETHYISKDDAYRIYQTGRATDIGDAVREYGNPFSASLDIKVTNASKISTVADSLSSNPIVKKVKYSQQTIDVINNGTRILRNAGLFLIAMLIIISILVVVNTVRLAIYTRRQEIEIMKLVGATNWFIQWPFILEAIYDGIIASLLAAAVIFFAFDTFSGQLVDLSYLLKIPKPELNLTIALRYGLYQIGAGALLGAVSSWISVQRHLRS